MKMNFWLCYNWINWFIANFFETLSQNDGQQKILSWLVFHHRLLKAHVHQIRQFYPCLIFLGLSEKQNSNFFSPNPNQGHFYVVLFRCISYISNVLKSDYSLYGYFTFHRLQTDSAEHYHPFFTLFICNNVGSKSLV